VSEHYAAAGVVAVSMHTFEKATQKQQHSAAKRNVGKGVLHACEASRAMHTHHSASSKQGETY
jgi:hypothetical protein